MQPELREKTLEAIVDAPFTASRRTLMQALFSNRMTDVQLAEILADIRTQLPQEQQAGFDQSLAEVQQAIAQDTAPPEIDLQSDAGQLIWAACLLHRGFQGPTALPHMKLWRQLLHSPTIEQQEITHARHISAFGINEQTQLHWGAPGSMFYYNPAADRINMDLVGSLILGWENSRSVIYHEMGHSKLTRHFPDRMQEIHTEMEAIKQAAKTEQRRPTADEQKQLRRLDGEWSMRFRLFDEAENNVVDRFACNQGVRMHEPYDVTLNRVEVSIQSAKDFTPPQEGSATERFHHVMKTIRMSFFKNNGLFADTTEGWNSVGVRPDWITMPNATQGEAFAHLKAICGGPVGLEHLQPSRLDQARGRGYFAAKTQEYASKRNAIMDEIWEMYLAPLAQQILDEKEQRRDEQQQQKSDKPEPSENPEQSDPQEQDPAERSQQDTSSSPGQGDEGDEEGMPETPPETPQEARQQQKGQQQPGQQQPQESPDNQSKGEEAEPQAGKGKGDPSEDQSNAEAGEGTPGAGESSGPENKAATEEKNHDSDPGNTQGQKPDNAESKEHSDPEKDASQEAGEKEAQEKPDPAAEAKDTDTDDKTAAGDRPDDAAAEEAEREGKTLKELMDRFAEQQRGSQPKDAPDESKQNDAARAPKLPGEKTSKGAGRSDEKSHIHMGDWKDYQETVSAVAGEISQVRRGFENIMKRMSRSVPKPISTHELLPEDGDMGRFDMSAHVRLVETIFSGQGVTEEHAKRFTKDHSKRISAPMTTVLLTDGSDSMYSNRSAKGKYWESSPIDAAVEVGCMINEAVQRLPIDFYHGLWGNDTPLLLSQPKDRPQQVAEAIAGIRDPQNWGTALAPSIRCMTEYLAQQKGKPAQMVGNTHFIIVSDGDIQDERAATVAVEALLTHGKHVMLDILIIEDKEKPMHTLAAKLQKKFPDQMNVVHVDHPNQAKQAMVELLNDRVRTTLRSDAVTARTKQMEMAKASNAMGGR